MQSPVPSSLLGRLASSKARYGLLQRVIRQFSYSSLDTLYTGKEVARRRVGPSLLLPYFSYRWNQLWRKASAVLWTKA